MKMVYKIALMLLVTTMFFSIAYAQSQAIKLTAESNSNSILFKIQPSVDSSSIKKVSLTVPSRDNKPLYGISTQGSSCSMSPSKENFWFVGSNPLRIVCDADSQATQASPGGEAKIFLSISDEVTTTSAWDVTTTDVNGGVQTFTVVPQGIALKEAKQLSPLKEAPQPVMASNPPISIIWGVIIGIAVLIMIVLFITKREKS